MRKDIILEKLKGDLVISAQAQENEPLYNEIAMKSIISTIVELGHGHALRLAGKRDIKNTKEKYGENVVVIGITKPKIIPENYKELVYITPSIADANSIIEAGADIVAFDATQRFRPNESIEEIINFIHDKNKLAMADIATYNEAKIAADLGADIISTTLSGYTKETENLPETPDFALLSECVQKINCPIILEGKIWTQYDVKHAFEIGAHAVVIGSAVTRPQKIVEYYKKGITNG